MEPLALKGNVSMKSLHSGIRELTLKENLPERVVRAEGTEAFYTLSECCTFTETVEAGRVCIRELLELGELDTHPEP